MGNAKKTNPQRHIKNLYKNYKNKLNDTHFIFTNGHHGVYLGEIYYRNEFSNYFDITNLENYKFLLEKCHILNSYTIVNNTHTMLNLILKPKKSNIGAGTVDNYIGTNFNHIKVNNETMSLLAENNILFNKIQGYKFAVGIKDIEAVRSVLGDNSRQDLINTIQQKMINLQYSTLEAINHLMDLNLNRD